MRKMFGILAIAGFMLQLGTVGALENDVIGIMQALMQLGAGGACMFIGLKGARVL